MKLQQQGNEIIVTELMSVSYVPQGEIVLISKNGMIKPGVYAGGGFVRFMDENYCGANIEDCDGWLPMPQYRSGAEHIDKTELYERLQKCFGVTEQDLKSLWPVCLKSAALTQRLN